MKRFLQSLFCLLMVWALFPSQAINAESFRNNYTVVLEKIHISLYTDPNEVDNDDRTPAGKNSAIISREAGVNIAGCPEQIDSFEIWTDDGKACLLSTDEEKEFLIEFFALKGQYQIRFLTDEHAFIGYVEIG